MEHQFTFLRVKEGRTYFARVVVALRAKAEGINVQSLEPTTAQNRDIPSQWIEAARLGAENARQAHLSMGGNNTGLEVTAILGTEVDTTDSAIEAASFCAACMALGHAEADLTIEYGQDWKAALKQSI